MIPRSFKGKGAVSLPFLLILFFLGSTNAYAHRQPEVTATLVHAVEDGQPITKVTWRLHAHDAIDALARIPEVTAASLDEEDNLIELAGYVASWVDYSDEAAPITLGAEPDGNFVFVYQMIPGHVSVKKSAILSDVASGWSNLINREVEGQTVSSTVFTARYPEGTGESAPH